MDSELKSVMGALGQSQWTSHVSKARAPPLSRPHCDVGNVSHDNSPGAGAACTSGLQIWVKDVSTSAEDDAAGAGGGGGGPALALLLVNHGAATLPEYSLDISQLPSYFKHGGQPIEVRDIWGQKTLPATVGGGGGGGVRESSGGGVAKPLEFKDVASHDSVFYVLRPAKAAAAAAGGV